MRHDETFADCVINFYKTIKPPKKLPSGVCVLNPYTDTAVSDTVTAFYKKYFNDTNKRIFLIGINPGRLGAGATGIAFTDTNALRQCGIPNTIPETQELSAEFVYRVIEEYGGPKKFYKHFFITSICPFGFKKDGVNFNYYDDTAFMKSITPYIRKTFEIQLSFGAEHTAVVLGKGKNYNAIRKMNDTFNWFEEVLPLEHPRFIMQYRRKSADEYCHLFVRMLNGIASKKKVV